MKSNETPSVARRNKPKNGSKPFQKTLASAKKLLCLLSMRESQVFKLLAEGRSIPEIADKLSLSPKTVGVHRANIRKKIGFQNAVQLVRMAIRCNVIKP